METKRSFDRQKKILYEKESRFAIVSLYSLTTITLIDGSFHKIIDQSLLKDIFASIIKYL